MADEKGANAAEVRPFRDGIKTKKLSYPQKLAFKPKKALAEFGLLHIVALANQ